MPLSVVSKVETVPLAEPARAPIAVLKFGSSVLRGIDDLPRVAGEIYRRRREGWRLVVVVSALAGETDALFAQAAAVAGGVDCTGVADLVSLGEERTAALLRIACDRIGLTAAIFRPEALGLATQGESLNAHPVALDDAALRAALDETGLVMVPGFVGLDAMGRRTLLGRGGSDLSAVFLARALGAEKVRLYKDVDGVYDRDPAILKNPKRFTDISWTDAARVAGKLIQPQAIDHAAQFGLPVEITQIGGDEPTRVGACTGAAAQAAPRHPLRVALAGYGVVGQALAQRLATEPDFEIAAILVRDPGRARAVTPPCPPGSDADAFLAMSADILVDALSCDATGEALSRRLLASGRYVVSASKRVIARAGAALDALAAAHGGALLHSAAVGGAAPVLETVAEARRAGEIADIAAVLNGTVNFILDRLHAGADLESALGEARAAGFAEEDSSADLEGHDAAAKLRLIAARAFGVDPAGVEVATEALDDMTAARIRASGRRWVQAARLTEGTARVELVPTEQAGLPALPGEWNCARVTTRDGREFTCVGRGAGGAATAEAIVADLFDIRDIARR
jgi:homoserine dehydrogenase